MQSDYAAPGVYRAGRRRVVEHQLFVRNRSRYAQQYMILVEGNGWRTEARPASTPVIAPNESALVSVAVFVPRVRRPAQDVARVRALSLHDGGTLATAFVRTLYR